MKKSSRIADWLETRWVTPAYSGWALGGFALCFFGSAINTMAGWLYVISGISFALLLMAAILPVRSLRGITIQRYPIAPVSVGDQLSVELEIQNQSNQPKTLLQVQDTIPFVLGQPLQQAIEIIGAQDSYRWIYYHSTSRRGVYRWQTVQLRTAAPLGLFWCRRVRNAPATAIVYPTVLPLTSCPLIDEMGQEDNVQFYSRDRRSHSSTEDLTRSLRPYRWGDPIRLVHWKTSARYGELRVRELEVFTGSQEPLICLDSAGTWHPEDFEQAVIAAASLYFYANRCQLNAKLWTAGTGLVHGNRVVLEALASVEAQEEASATEPPNKPLIWITQTPQTLSSLPVGSRYLLWSAPSSTEQKNITSANRSGCLINPEESLQIQLQSSLR
jgi:uncharacterized protein (DUF58 family)